MKIKSTDLAVIKSAILAIPFSTVKTHAAAVRNAYAVNPDKTPEAAEMRILWDLYYYAVPNELRNEFYQYLNDSHLETALRKIAVEIPALSPNA